MDIQQLNFKHLFYFWQVASRGQLTRAARELHVSQSALSTQIKQLEERLGEQLFLREGRKLVLTESGIKVASYAEGIFGLGQEMLGWLEGHYEGRIRVRVGGVATMSKNYQENWIRPLMENPRVLLTVESGQLDGLVEKLLNHQLDVVLANEPVLAEPERPLRTRFMGSQSISLVGQASEWQGRQFRIPEDLDGLPLVLPGARHSLRAEFDALCLAAGVTPTLRAELDDMTMLRLVARDSGWLTVLPEVVVQDELKSGLLVKVGESRQLQERFYAITLQRHLPLEPLEKLLTEFEGLSGEDIGKQLIQGDRR